MKESDADDLLETLHDYYADHPFVDDDTPWSWIHEEEEEADVVEHFFDVFVFNSWYLPQKHHIENKLTQLRSVPQPAQKSQEWLDQRHQMITASSAWKILKSPAQRNSFIYEKCKETPSTFSSPSVRWGQKYEPLSIQIYEELNATKIEEFGCIQHTRYPFLGASPDGINVDSGSSKFGTMLEIKNIVNRTITGIPKNEHWIQTQLQMEVCGLELCDLVETRFIECSWEEYQISEKRKGVLVEPWFEKPIYMPVEFTQNPHDWFSGGDRSPLGTIVFWILDEYSCIEIPRDREWFAASIGAFQETWNCILAERMTGCDHRKPKSRKPAAANVELFTVSDEEKQKWTVVKLE
jgi:putative phage-type endonuclease